MGSIVGVMDNAGALIERVSYDPYGRPTIEAADADPPQVSSIERQANGDLLVAFTEAVLPPPSTTAGTTIVNSLASLSGAVTLLRDVSGTMTAVAGTWSYEEAATGFDHGTVLRFVPGESLAAGSAVALSVNAGGLIDSWSNAASAVTLNFNIGAGVLYTGPPQRSTSTPVVERSLVGNGLLFQAHLWDADAGLYLARARVLDPTTGTFLSRDPSGYSDSVNLYAGFKSDPVNHRDATGMAADPEMLAKCLATPNINLGDPSYCQMQYGEQQPEPAPAHELNWFERLFASGGAEAASSAGAKLVQVDPFLPSPMLAGMDPKQLSAEQEEQIRQGGATFGVGVAQVAETEGGGRAVGAVAGRLPWGRLLGTMPIR
ncbi:MAG: RHS repeat-associated core domain-containing protein [Deltaproteobacteria bacterium]|nr:RHS repeat-associated core domain-containing protein [Deltaproteobacteria bacterium]